MRVASTIVAGVVLALAAAASAETVAARFGGRSAKASHPDTMRTIPGQPPRVVFDLSAIPRDARVYRGELFCAGDQPREPVRIFAIKSLEGDKLAPAAGPLELAPPYFRSFDVTEAVRNWVAAPDRNFGLVFASFEGDLARTLLEVRYEGQPAGKLPPPVDQLKAIHHDGQTFLTFRELPAFRPQPAQIVWIDDYADADNCVKPDPGTGALGNPRIPAVRLDVLRNLQGLAVRTTPGAGQAMPAFKKIRELPDVNYRVWRSDKPITPETFKDALCVGQAEPLNAYDQSMVKIYSDGEYYNKREQPDNIIGTFCVADYQGVLPGQAFYVHTPYKDGQAYYAVTVEQDGVENTLITAGNATKEPMVEKAQLPKPLKYYSMKAKVRARHDDAMSIQYLFWIAPPLANVPDQKPKRIGFGVPADFKEPGPLLIDFRAVGADTPGTINLGMEPAGDLVYNDGQGTLKSYRQSRLEPYPERYFFHIVQWAKGIYNFDPARIAGTKYMSLHLAIRHPEIFGVFWPDRPEFFQNDFDQKWNPAYGTLAGKVGPVDIVKAPDGSPGWNIFDIAWYLRQDVSKDIPFMGCLFQEPKDGNHGAEYGWQDDPKGYAALRDCRQPFVGMWGRGSIAHEVRDFLMRLRWDKSVPAFSWCSLDNCPGNGDADDGDIWGQINGYLVWDYDTVTDSPDKWEMTVSLVPSCPESACVVDVTPRHCKAFKPKAGAKLAFANVSLADNKPVASGELTADKWGLVTIPKALVAKGGNRLTVNRREMETRNP